MLRDQALGIRDRGIGETGEDLNGRSEMEDSERPRGRDQGSGIGESWSQGKTSVNDPEWRILEFWLACTSIRVL